MKMIGLYSSKHFFSADSDGDGQITDLELSKYRQVYGVNVDMIHADSEMNSRLNQIEWDFYMETLVSPPVNVHFNTSENSTLALVLRKYIFLVSVNHSYTMLAYEDNFTKSLQRITQQNGTVVISKIQIKQDGTQTFVMEIYSNYPLNTSVVTKILEESILNILTVEEVLADDTIFFFFYAIVGGSGVGGLCILCILVQCCASSSHKEHIEDETEKADTYVNKTEQAEPSSAHIFDHFSFYDVYFTNRNEGSCNYKICSTCADTGYTGNAHRNFRWNSDQIYPDIHCIFCCKCLLFIYIMLGVHGMPRDHTHSLRLRNQV